MISRTKKELNEQEIQTLCAAAGFTGIDNIHPLGAGEFNAVYAFDAGGKEYAMKIAPSADTPVMTYEHDMMRTEVFWYEQISRHTDISIPQIVYTDFSRTLQPSDFFIMERIPGKQMNEMDFTPEEMEEVTALLPKIAVEMHGIQNGSYGYPQNGFHDTWAQALQAMTEAVVQDADRMGHACETGEQTLRYIRKHRAVLERVPCRMVNFDLWWANIICDRTDNGMRFTMIDPERGFWGDPIMDFVCFEFGKPLREKKESLQAYNRLSQEPVTIGRKEEIRYAFAMAYLGVIMEVERYYRYTPGDKGWTRNDSVCKHLFDAAFSCLEEV